PRAGDRIDFLFIIRSSERYGRQHLRFPAGEKSRAVHAGENTDITTNVSNVVVIATVNTLLGVKRQLARVGCLELFEVVGDQRVLRLVFVILRLGNSELLLGTFLYGGQGFVTLKLFADGKRLLETTPKLFLHLCFEIFVAERFVVLSLRLTHL